MRLNINPLDNDTEQAFIAKVLPSDIAKAVAREQQLPRTYRPLPRTRAQMRSHIDGVRRLIRAGGDVTYDVLGLSIAGLRYYFQTVCGSDYETADILAHAAAELIER